MTESHGPTLELQRARNGHDLWAAVEAAQYARLIDHDEPRSEDEATRINELIAYFSDCAEEWEEKSTSDQTVVLERFGNHLDALEQMELHVYWAVTQGRFDSEEGGQVDLPVGVLIVAREDEDGLAVNLPDAAGVD